ncbi:hypothetical protein, partial [Klebsiella pneumoniae]|uniref:hypothetical protein n=1 Tax=Klebsiella pneumoniae TaxID=573 RepID=UPI002175D303
MNHDLMAVYAASEIVELLTLCQELQSEKDGRERPAPGAYSRDEDAFAERIRSACGHALLLRRLLPVTTTLSAIGAEMEGTVAKLAMRQPFVLFKGLTFQKLCLPGAFRP